MKQALPPRPVEPAAAGPPPAGGRPRNKLLPFAIAALVIGGAFNLIFHHGNRYEKLASDVTKAIAANDMHSVAPDFNAIRRAQLQDRGKVGSLSDFVNDEGKLKSVKEDTPSGSKEGYHHFIATFERGQRAEDLTLDPDGKIVDFHVRPLETK